MFLIDRRLADALVLFWCQPVELSLGLVKDGRGKEERKKIGSAKKMLDKISSHRLTTKM